ncbi:helix-turn-helix domain-containing protein [Bacillus thuringiensis]|uniref:helix-turn-helix domain-containing protein n=1 Tax=Bacillus thuringiensis TaxID=1428 RepID=UPI000BF5F2A3|nr:helix-turn-helix transcriptional regulator [Bacillus thuringiensis]MCU5063148.1 helix-turn-helix transcriptional regulator [Bacillus cereus]MDA2518646.1 helix-turn-helix transcriptional regulator [Bacillus cereus]PFV88082.1 transcriptional regulator [Bacillus thuringiensis]PGR97436.1 transcriptional regulator [Bacillus thuringiensis]
MLNNNKKTKLKIAFDNSDFTYEKLAEIVGISKSYCYKIINVHKYKKNIYYGIAAKIARALNEDVSELFNEHQIFLIIKFPFGIQCKERR